MFNSDKGHFSVHKMRRALAFIFYLTNKEISTLKYEDYIMCMKKT